MTEREQRQYEKDRQAGIEMATYLMGLSDKSLARYKDTNPDLLRIVRPAWNHFTPEEQNKMLLRGITPKADDYNTHAGRDIEDIPLAAEIAESDSDDADDEANPEIDASSTAPIINLSRDEQTWHVVREVLIVIMSDPNARLSAECFMITSGLGYFEGVSQVDIAKKHGLTRAAVSKRCKRQLKLLGISPSQFMRPLNLCKKYSDSRNKVVARNANPEIDASGTA